jgi:hypothetical protein
MPNPAVISSGLNALMLLQKGMEALQKNPPSTQGPAGPTIAMQAQQAAQQAMAGQSFAPPPPGQPQPQQNGVVDIAQNAGIGAQIQAQQQQAAQQAMMAQAQQQAQQPPQQMARGGIAGLNAHNMRGFKTGGVLGFDGTKPQGSEVPAADSFAQGEYEQKDSGLTPREILEKVISPESYLMLNSQPTVEDNMAVAEAIALNKRIASEKLNADRDKMMALSEGEKEQPKERPQRDAGIVAALQNKIQREQQDNRKIPISPNSGGQQVAKSPAISGQDFVMNMMKGVKELTPQVNPSEQRAETTRLKEMRDAQPLPGIEQLAAHRKAQAAIDALNAEQNESSGSRRLDALIEGFRTRNVGNTMTAFQSAELARKKTAALEEESRAQLSGALVDAQAAKKIGDQEKYIAAIKDINSIIKDNADRQSNLAGHMGSAAASLYHTDTMAKIEMLKLNTMNEANQLAKTANSIGTFNSSLAKFNNNKQAIAAELDKTFNDRHKAVIALAGAGDKAAKTEYETALAQHEVYKAKEVKAINDQIYKTERAMWEQHEKSKGLPPPVNLNDIANNSPAAIPFNKLPTK